MELLAISGLQTEDNYSNHLVYIVNESIYTLHPSILIRISDIAKDNFTYYSPARIEGQRANFNERANTLTISSGKRSRQLFHPYPPESLVHEVVAQAIALPGVEMARIANVLESASDMFPHLVSRFSPSEELSLGAAWIYNELFNRQNLKLP